MVTKRNYRGATKAQWAEPSKEEVEEIIYNKNAERFTAIWKYFKAKMTTDLFTAEIKDYDALLEEMSKGVDKPYINPKTGLPKSSKVIEAERNKLYVEYLSHRNAVRFLLAELLKVYEYTPEQIDEYWQKWVIGGQDPSIDPYKSKQSTDTQ